MCSRHLIILLPLSCILLSGCASQNAQTAGAQSKEKEEYVYYTPTGSNIPVRVRKDQLQASASETDQAQHLLTKIQQPKNQPKQPGEN